MGETNNEELYRSLYNESRDGVIYFKGSTIVDANKAALSFFEVELEEFIGKEIHQFTGRRDESNETSIDKKHMLLGIQKLRIETKSGSKFVEVHLIPIQVGEYSMYSIVRDITEKTQLEQRYREIFEKSADLILVTNETGVVFINPTGLKYLGLEHEYEIIGKSTLKFIHSDYRDLATLYSALRRAGGNPPSQYRSKMVRQDGTILDVEFNASFIHWDGVPSSLTIVRDIGEQVQLEEELLKSEAEKQAILNSIPDSITLRDLDYNLIWVNQNEKNSLGLTDEEIIGAKCYIIGFGFEKPCEDCKVPQVRKTGKGTNFIKELPNGRFFDINIEPIYDEQGNITSFLEIARDISQQVQNERNLRESEERLTGFLDAATDGYSILDSDMKYLMVNETELQFTGKKREDYLGKHILEVFPDLKGTARYQGYLQVLETGEPVEYRNALVQPGSNKIFELSAFKAGDLLGIVAKNVTEQVRYQRQIEALHSHSLQISQFETKDEIAKGTMDIIRDLLGFRIGSFGFVEKNTINFTEISLENGLTELDINGKGVTARAVRTGMTQLVNDTRNDPDYISGGLLEHSTLSELDVPIKVEQEVVAVINLEALQTSAFSEEDRRLVETLGGHVASAIAKIEYEHRLNALHDFALTLNRLDTVEIIAYETLTMINNIFNFPYASFGVLEDNNLWFHTLDNIELTENYHLSLNENGVTVRAVKSRQTQIVPDVSKDPDYVSTSPFNSKSGKPITLTCEVAVPVFEHDRVLGVINVESGIPSLCSSETIRLVQLLGEHVSSRLTSLRLERERVRAEQAEEMEKLKTRFMSTATHELRTPLTSMKGYLELAQTEEDTDKIRSYIDVAYRNTNRLEALTNDLLDQQRIDAGKMLIDRLPVDINELVVHILSEVSGLVESRGQGITKTLPAVSPSIIGDELRLGQVLVNLIDNASKYSPTGSTIHIEVETSDDQVQISVVDQGEGINEEDLDKLFKPFPDIKKPVISEQSVGLGLSICKGFVELHGGRIWAESSGNGKGSRFTFTLPI